MPASKHILNTYESISATTGHMLEAARSGDWDRLVALEQSCRALIETLRSGDAATPLEHDIRQRKVEIIRKVLADDAEIRNLTEPWMQRLQHLLTSVGQERKLHAAYNAGTAD